MPRRGSDGLITRLGSSLSGQATRDEDGDLLRLAVLKRAQERAKSLPPSPTGKLSAPLTLPFSG
jgi:hypothetical protein